MSQVCCTSFSLITSGISAQSSKCARLSSANLVSSSLRMESNNGIVKLHTNNHMVCSCLTPSYDSRHCFFTTNLLRQDHSFVVNAILLNIYVSSDFCVMLCDVTDLSEPKVNLL